MGATQRELMNWSAHFAARSNGRVSPYASPAPAQGASFGGEYDGPPVGPWRGYYGPHFGSDHSFSDLQALIANKDVEMTAMDAQINTAKPDQKLVDDWRVLKARYGAAKNLAVKAINDRNASWLPNWTPGTGGDIDTAYQAVITALQPVPTSVTPGDKQDIANRLMAKGWVPKYTLPQQYQQDAGSTFLQWTDPTNIANAAKKLPGALPQPWKWMIEHPNELLIGALVVVAGIGLVSIMPMLTLPAKLAKVAKGTALLAA
jgi:hypothetical protein